MSCRSSARPSRPISVPAACISSSTSCPTRRCIDAKEHPENYPELLVRVSGYSAYFKDLNDAMKDEIITRTAYDLKSGKSVPFPEEQKGMIPST